MQTGQIRGEVENTHNVVKSNVGEPSFKMTYILPSTNSIQRLPNREFEKDA